MAYAAPQFGQHAAQRDAKITSQRALPTQPYFTDDESAILDPAVLDADLMQSPPDHPLRKGSMASNGVLSPAESEGWIPQYGGDVSLEPHPSAASAGYHPEHHQSSYYAHGLPHPPPAYGHHQQPQNWHHAPRSGPATPNQVVEVVTHHPQQYEAYHHAPPQQRADSARGSFSQPMPPLPPAPAMPYHPPPQHAETSYATAPQVQTPMSPHCHQDWMNLAQQEVESRPVSKRMRPASPRETNVDFQRRDGIRKKNGRIDIPHERNIESIDHMIESTTDENMLKELKQQKRLLRNREAALASRQRKKKHTEDLETREKEFNRQMGNLHDQLQALNIDRQKLEHDHGVLFHQYEEQRRINEALELEKRDMTMKHNEETSSLRRKIQVLEKDLESRPEGGLRAPPMSAEPSSTGFTEINGELEALNMGPEWDSIFFNDVDNDSLDTFTFDTIPEFERQPPAVEKKSSSSTIVPSPPKKSHENLTEPPMASGLLFFLLLCGAFVASKPASSRSADLPQVPPDVRAAAPKVLDNLLAENNAVVSQSTSRRQLHDEPAPSHPPQSSSRSRGRLDQVHQRITSPTKQQEIDAAASLTPAQYASLTNMDYAYGERSTSSQQPRTRPSLAEAFANTQEEQPRSSKAEVYTRSLLWDQIPPHVVQQFKEVIRDHQELESRRQPTKPAGGGMGFKLEG